MDYKEDILDIIKFLIWFAVVFIMIKYSYMFFTVYVGMFIVWVIILLATILFLFIVGAILIAIEASQEKNDSNHD